MNWLLAPALDIVQAGIDTARVDEQGGDHPGPIGTLPPNHESGA